MLKEKELSLILLFKVAIPAEASASIDYLITAYSFFFTIVPCILILSKSFIYQLMHSRVALKEY
jgi:hypothetical protein